VGAARHESTGSAPPGRGVEVEEWTRDGREGGSNDRGTRRVVTGDSGEQYWSADHYATFQEIDSRC
ncbi:ribonuclease domain-containing protein, partial [Kitasatospora sp. NPDC091257]|uniref:ribonuclease domain-containing protein n=1 Tax=Kitasatospora sp. NPDC091257 TaxID=3364084 RepID=UPI003808BAEC